MRRTVNARYADPALVQVFKGYDYVQNDPSPPRGLAKTRGFRTLSLRVEAEEFALSPEPLTSGGHRYGSRGSNDTTVTENGGVLGMVNRRQQRNKTVVTAVSVAVVTVCTIAASTLWALQVYNQANVQVVTFFASLIGLVPLVKWIGDGVEIAAEHCGVSLCALINSLGSNIPELIVGTVAILHGFDGLVRAFLVGCMLYNLMFLLGVCMVAGGSRYMVMRFPKEIPSLRSTQLFLAVVIVAVPTIMKASPVQAHDAAIVDAAVEFILLATFTCAVMAALPMCKRKTRVDGSSQADLESVTNLLTTIPDFEGAAESQPEMPILRALGLAGASTLGCAWLTFILFQVLKAAAVDIDLPLPFIGGVVLGFLGVVGHFQYALDMTLINRLDAVIDFGTSSTAQVMLFCLPILALVSLIVNGTLDILHFNIVETTVVAVSVVMLTIISVAGRVNWLSGFQLICVYVIMASAFFVIR